MQVIGWSMWFSGYVFVERIWVKDERTLQVSFNAFEENMNASWFDCFYNIHIWCDSVLQSGFQQLEDFPLPFWLALFVEGTRFTEAKLLSAQEYAASRRLPVPRNVLIPHTKVNLVYIFPKIFSAVCFLFESF